MALQKDHADAEILCFPMADAVFAALPTQGTPQGYYNIELMVRSVIARGGQVKLCGTCCEARGIKGLALVEGADIGTMSALTQWTATADKVLVF